MDRRRVVSALYCTRCGVQGLLVTEGDDYYHGSTTLCPTCDNTGCCEEFTEWKNYNAPKPQSS